MKKESFGKLPTGEQAFLYTLTCGQLQAQVTDFGATLVRLYVPDKNGKMDDVVLGYENVAGYRTTPGYLGATVGRNANRIGGAKFPLGNKMIALEDNDKGNNLHSGSESFAYRFWKVESYTENAITFSIESPDGDQGFPGNAQVWLTYSLEPEGVLRLHYEAVCDQDTVFNMTNHSYFNLAGHKNTPKAMEQYLTLPARFFTPSDEKSIPTGEMRDVAGTPMDFREPTKIGSRIHADYDALNYQGGYDHNFEVFTEPGAILQDRESGRTMTVVTDCPGIQFYSGNYLEGQKGKDGAVYPKRSGICLETQFWPDALNKPNWKKPIVKAGERFVSETCYIFHV